MATLSLEQVTKVFGNGVEAVRQLDLFVDEGEFVVLVGPSGCGKTTALRMVAGLEAVTSGTIRLDGKVINDLTAKDRDVAMVFQNYALYPHMNVLDNIAFSLRVRGVAKQERHRKARETADVLGLSEVVLRKPPQLSGGQRQRVAMGRALVREPAVFLMDEPLSNLDANLRVQMRSEVLRVQRRLGVATLYVTHDQTEAMTMGDRVAVLRERRPPAARRPAALVRAAREPLRRLVHRLACDEPVRGDGLGACGSARPLARIAAARASRRPRAAPPGSRCQGAQARGRDPARASDRGSSGGWRRRLLARARSPCGPSSWRRSATSRSSTSRPTRGKCATAAASSRQTWTLTLPGRSPARRRPKALRASIRASRSPSAISSRSRSTSIASTSSMPRPATRSEQPTRRPSCPCGRARAERTRAERTVVRAMKAHFSRERLSQSAGPFSSTGTFYRATTSTSAPGFAGSLVSAAWRRSISRRSYSRSSPAPSRRRQLEPGRGEPA